jgi:hypothetical protein
MNLPTSWIATTLDPNTPVPDGLLDDDGHLKLMPADFFDTFSRDSIRLWCHQFARYGLPTIETVDWVKSYIAGRSAIEVGSGAGDLAHHLAIRATDSKVQASLAMAELYRDMSQPPVVYPAWVEKIDGVSAVRKYKPQVVVAQWVTQWIDPNLPPPPGGGSVFGLKEDEILDEGVTYIMIGNRRIHGTKKILARPHKEYELPFLRSRATYPELDVVYVWEGTK